MRAFRQVVLIGALAALSVGHAQVMTDPGLQSTPTPQLTPTPIPDITAEPTIPEREQIDQIFKQTSLGKEADERRLHIEWRELANRVVNEPDIIEAKKAADTAHTDLEKRQKLRTYYALYYGRMRSLASSSEMKSALDQLETAHISRTSQKRVRAVEDASLPSPSPTPKKKEKKNQRLKK
ncbi:MAG TPA: hypothetical protein VJ721_02930, partial [Chthoniobacterales bacterium]|nr:hypothetical protein [Chthoniobacterales bacterium]